MVFHVCFSVSSSNQRKCRFPIGGYQRQKKKLNVSQVQLHLELKEENNKAIETLKVELEKQKGELELLTRQVKGNDERIVPNWKVHSILAARIIPLLFSNNSLLHSL